MSANRASLVVRRADAGQPSVSATAPNPERRSTCFGTAAKVRAHVDPFFASLAARADEVKQRCRTVLQAKADALGAVTAATAIL